MTLSNDTTETRVTKTCPTCGELFTRFRCLNQKFCSRRCAAQGRPTVMGHHATYECDVCGKQFAGIVSMPRRYCSKGCERKGRTLDPVPIICANCGGTFGATRRKGTRRFCSRTCSYEFRRLADTPRRIVSRNRRALCPNNGVTPDEWESIKARYGNRCLCCGRTEPDISLTMDHVVPISRGGKHEAGNIQPLCGRCNCLKWATMRDFRTAIP